MHRQPYHTQTRRAVETCAAEQVHVLLEHLQQLKLGHLLQIAHELSDKAKHGTAYWRAPLTPWL